MAADIIFTTWVAAVAVFVYVTGWFILALYTRRNDIADIAWGPGIALVGIIALFAADHPETRLAALSALVLLWAMRLSLHILRRALSGGEDERYRAWRTAWGRWFIPRSYAQVFLLQGALMLVIGYPLIHAAAYSAVPWGIVETLGILVWACGLAIETVSDAQLARFIRIPGNKGKACDAGLWRYSRHPNYFGEVLMWWGIGIAVLGLPYGFLALVSPVTITLLILYVSGVPLLEKRLMERPEYRAYAARTSVLVPLPPKQDAA